MAIRFTTSIKSTPVILEVAAEHLFGEEKFTGTIRRTSGELFMYAPKRSMNAVEAQTNAILYARERASIDGFLFNPVVTKTGVVNEEESDYDE